MHKLPILLVLPSRENVSQIILLDDLSALKVASLLVRVIQLDSNFLFIEVNASCELLALRSFRTFDLPMEKSTIAASSGRRVFSFL